jgi:hypothetical protein
MGKKYEKEEDLMHQGWIEATRNFVQFTGETGVDGESGDWYKRWDARFSFFESWEDAVANFPAILELDIRLRKDYNALPFSYDASWYEKEYEKAKTEHSLKEIEDLAQPLRLVHQATRGSRIHFEAPGRKKMREPRTPEFLALPFGNAVEATLHPPSDSYAHGGDTCFQLVTTPPSRMAKASTHIPRTETSKVPTSCVEHQRRRRKYDVPRALLFDARDIVCAVSQTQFSPHDHLYSTASDLGTRTHAWLIWTQAISTSLISSSAC